MATAIANSNNTYTTDYKDAAEIYAKMYEDTNRFSWTQQLLLPSIQAAANLLILQWQKEQYDDIEEKRIDYIESAISQFKGCMDALKADMKDATDDVPLPAMYQPVSPGGEQWETLSENLTMMSALACHANSISSNHREHDLARMIVLHPGYYRCSELTWLSIERLMKGELPIGLTVETLTRSAERSIINGRLGRAHGQFRRDIGLVDYRIQKAARAEQREERASLNRDVNPLQRQGDIREMITTPVQRIGFAIQQAQLLQNALQNAYNACARKAPYLLNELQLGIQQCQQVMQLNAGKAGLVNSYVPNYLGIFNSQVRDLSAGIVNAFGNNRTVPVAQPQPFVPYGTIIPDYSSAK